MASEGYDQPILKSTLPTRWWTGGDMARALGSRRLMTLYFDDQVWMGDRFGGWMNGLHGFPWERDPEGVGSLANPPVAWFGGRPPHPDIAHVAAAALEVIQKVEALPDELRDWPAVAQSLFEETGVPLPPNLADSGDHPVSWPVAACEALLQTGNPAGHAAQWVRRVQADLERLARIHVLPRYNLLPFQEPAIQAWNAAGQSGILALPTATGKTVIGIEAIRQAIQAGGRRFLVLVPSRLLVHQWIGEIRHKLFLRDIPIASTQPSPKGNGIWVMTLQQAQRIGGPIGLSRPFDILIVDEVHRSLTREEGGYSEVIRRVRCSSKLGLSATVPEDLATSVLGPIRYSLDFRTASQSGFLPDFTMTFMPCPVTEDDQREYASLTAAMESRAADLRSMAEAEKGFIEAMAGEEWSLHDFTTWFRAAEREDERVRAFVGLDAQREQVLRDSRPKIEVAAAEIRARLGNRVGFVMADRIDFANAIHGLLDNVPGYLAHSEMSDSRRDEAIASIRAAERRALLVSAKLADEGLNVPQASIAFNVSAPATMTSMVQRLGRILRRHPSKPTPVFHHFESVPEWRHGAALTSQALDSAVTRYLLRAQDLGTLGKTLAFELPADAEASRAAFDEALLRIARDESTSADGAVQVAGARLRRAKRLFSRLSESNQREILQHVHTTLEATADSVAMLKGDTPTESFLREHGLFCAVAQRVAPLVKA